MTGPMKGRRVALALIHVRGHIFANTVSHQAGRFDMQDLS
jgi:hypothetical protein